MKKKLLALINEYNGNHGMLTACQMAMQQLYPQLKLRWSRIYGSRWAFLEGNSDDYVPLNPTRIRINNEYGLCIDNADVITASELEDISQSLKECLAYEACRR
ncbi:Uncharacterized [Syntrophomonas zehnderi OL-4]|uniref:Uncharacterized n=1 Tax=Syntrophomonas zehnderi OL-4 TaxID=690567 RepID=A0A0E4GCZ9_9FIRM|nr:hypothetical protein [Syntrophomonas zehnderi]CFY11633.1 Uncharacterized [Syntrophomonas zehnderi OL-4]